MDNTVTGLYFGLGFQSESGRTETIKQHITEMNDQGWRLIHTEKSGFSIPVNWRFYWERASEIKS